MTRSVRLRRNGKLSHVAPALWLALTAAGCGRQEAPVIRIGFVAPLSGDQAVHGMGMLRGAELALEKAQAAGFRIPGYRIELLPLDDQRNPTQAVAAAKKLVADPSVVAVIGHLNSSCTKPASAIYHEARMLQISPVSSNPDISRQGFDTFYRPCPTDDLQGPVAARFVVAQRGARRIYVLDDMTTYGRGLANEFLKKARALEVEILGHEGITQGDKDFTPLLTKIRAAGPDLIFYAGMFPEAALLIKQRHDLGIAATFMGGDGLYDPALIELATPTAAEGVYVTTIGTDPHSLPTAQAFIRDYEARYGSIGAYSAYTYESMNIILWALGTVGRPDRQAVLAAMKQLKDFPGVFGPMNFDEKGDSLIRQIGIFTVRDGKFHFLGTGEPD